MPYYKRLSMSDYLLQMKMTPIYWIIYLKATSFILIPIMIQIKIKKRYSYFVGISIYSLGGTNWSIGTVLLFCCNISWNPTTPILFIVWQAILPHKTFFFCWCNNSQQTHARTLKCKKVFGKVYKDAKTMQRQGRKSSGVN